MAHFKGARRAGRIRNGWAEYDRAPAIELAPLPSRGRFFECSHRIGFSGMSRAVIHNSDYKSVDEAKAAIDWYLADRNEYFRQHPRRAGKKSGARSVNLLCFLRRTTAKTRATGNRHWRSCFDHQNHVKTLISMSPVGPKPAVCGSAAIRPVSDVERTISPAATIWRVSAVGTPITGAPRRDPYAQLSRIRFPPRVSTATPPVASQRLCHAYPVPRPVRALLTRIPLGLRPSLHRLRSGCSARLLRTRTLFVGFTATMAERDFSCPCIIGYGSSPSRCGPSLSRNA